MPIKFSNKRSQLIGRSAPKRCFETFCMNQNMKTIITIFCLVVATTHAQQHQITQFQTSDGTITWSNPNTNLYYGIEHTTNLLNDTWSHPYDTSWWNIRSTNSLISTVIPMSVMEDNQIKYFRIRSSSTPLPPEYYSMAIWHVTTTPDYWTLKASAKTLNDVSIVFMTGESIQGEFELTPGELDPYGYQHWVSPTDYIFDQQPTLPAEFFIHMVSGSKTNTDTILISDYMPLNLFDDSLRNF